MAVRGLQAPWVPATLGKVPRDPHSSKDLSPVSTETCLAT